MEMTGKKVLVYGAGISGMGAARLLTQLGADVVLYDENPKGTLTREAAAEKLAAVGAGEAEIVLGELPKDLLPQLFEAVLSPGVPTDCSGVLTLKEAGVPVIGEVELAYSCQKGRLLAVTGTNGKTTTTSLLGAIMAAANPETFVVGNIGRAYTGETLKTTDNSVVVAEISSFQLETIDTFHPSVSAILNITEDHLNRHHTMEEYIRVKELITKNQTADDVCVLNYEDPFLREFGDVCPARVIWFSSARELEEGIFLRGDRIVLKDRGNEIPLMKTDEMLLIGVHNYENVMAACAMAYAAGVSPEVIIETVRTFPPVEHRIEFVAEKNGVIWYNDSKGTNPDAAIRGIRAMTRPTLLIGGGYDKQSDYEPWIREFGGRVKYFVLIGQTAEKIKEAALSLDFPEDRIVMAGNFDNAMEFCRTHAEAGDAVLLSPACASWGEFPNYEVRGERFKAYVREKV